jgi:hypothetical protein
MICCNDLEIETLYENINDGDYFEPVKRLSLDNPKSKYLKKLSKSKKVNDDIFLKYLLCKKNVKLLICKESNINDIFRSKPEILYQKSINTTNKGFYAMMFNFYSLRESEENFYSNISEMKLNDEKKKLNIFFYKASENHNNMEIQNFSNIYYFSTTFIETVIVSKTLLNENSIKIMEKQNLSRFSNLISNEKTNNKFNNLIKQYYTIFNMHQQDLFLIVSGLTEFSLGMKKFTDIDILSTQNNLYDEIIKLDFIDIKKKDHLKSIEKKYNYFSNKLFKIKNFYDEIDNPKLYYYFYGIKFINIKFVLINKHGSNFSRTFAFFYYYLNYIDPKEKIKFNKLPNYKIDTRYSYHTDIFYIMFQEIFNVKIKADKSNIREYMIEGKQLVFKKYNINDNSKNKVYEVDKEKFYKTIQSYLNKVYSTNVSIEELKEYISNNYTKIF